MLVRVFRPALLSLVTLFASILSGCVYLPVNPNYEGPPTRPAEVEEYYARAPYTSYKEFEIQKGESANVKRIILQTPTGEVVVDYFKQHKDNDSLILVFPLLGGKNMIPNYFAAYFSKKGYDTAIIHRSEDFKNPEYFDRIEETLRDNIVRDRIAIDFFEKEYGKKQFGSFGISRGAINAALTASVDSRLKYNVLAMGGSDLVSMFKHARVKKLKNYRDKIIAKKGITEEEFFRSLAEKVKTDPKYLAKFIDARNTLMFLAMFDSTVPIKNGMALREAIGEPRTVYLAADHFVSAMYTGMAKILPPSADISLFPFDYIETESLDFYGKRFKDDGDNLGILPFRILQVPMNILQHLVRPFL